MERPGKAKWLYTGKMAALLKLKLLAFVSVGWHKRLQETRGLVVGARVTHACCMKSFEAGRSVPYSQV